MYCVAGLFVNYTISLSDKFKLNELELDVTPADWTFYVNGLIYFWQGLWLTYAFTLFLRKINGVYIYIKYPFLPPIVFIVFSFALICNVSWLLIWDKQYMEVALVFINLMSCTLYICLISILRRLHSFGLEMAKDQLHLDIWLVRLLVCNGIAMFAAWSSVASMFNFAVVLTYSTITESKLEVGSTVAIAIFALEIICWWIFENFMFEKLLRYLYTPYIVLIYSMIGIMHRNWNPNSINCQLIISLFAAVIFLATSKTIISIYRHNKYPQYVFRTTVKTPNQWYEIRHLLNNEPPARNFDYCNSTDVEPPPVLLNVNHQTQPCAICVNQKLPILNNSTSGLGQATYELNNDPELD